MDKRSVYRISMDQSWQLDDLYRFPRSFAQTYAFAYCLETDLEPRDSERIDAAFAKYPWRGGYSIVNIYGVLQAQVPLRDRPRIRSIRYESPGWLELYLNLDPAVQVASSVAAIAGSLAVTTKAYASIQKTLYQIREQRERSKLKHLELSASQASALLKLSKNLSKLIGFARFSDLVERTGDLEVASKLLVAQFRRLKIIATFVEKGKVTLPLKGEAIAPPELPRRAKPKRRKRR